MRPVILNRKWLIGNHYKEKMEDGEEVIFFYSRVRESAVCTSFTIIDCRLLTVVIYEDFVSMAMNLAPLATSNTAFVFDLSLSL